MESLEKAIKFILGQQKISDDSLKALMKVLNMKKLSNHAIDLIEGGRIELKSDLGENLAFDEFEKYVAENLKGYRIETGKMPTDSYVFFVYADGKKVLRVESYLPVPELLMQQKKPSAPTSGQYQ
jgi:hypothetical protein